MLLALGAVAGLRTATPRAAAAAEEAAAPGRGTRCEYEVRRAEVDTLHRAIDGFLARGLCRLDLGTLCRTGRDGRPFAEGRASFPGTDGEWAVSGHSGESGEVTGLLFDVTFQRAPSRVCEVGFNAGHSAATLLGAAGGNASYLGFDLSVLNPGSNEAMFELFHAWMGTNRHLEIHWGDADKTVPRYLANRRDTAAGCDVTFYDGRHDAISVLHMLPLLRRLASRARALIVIDDVRCQGGLCGQSSLAWDFLVWAGLIRQLRCVSASSLHASAVLEDRGACVGEFQWGRRAAPCSAFDARCVVGTYQEAYAQGLGPREWPRCCLSASQATPPQSAASMIVEF